MGFETNKAIITFEGQELNGLHILSIKVDRKRKVQGQPIEDGSHRQDSYVREPITVSMDCAVHSEDWDGVKQTLASMYKEKTSKTSTINTKVEVLKNMALEEFPYDVDPENYDTLFFSLTFKEIIVVGKTSDNDSITAAANSENNSTSSSSPNPTSTSSSEQAAILNNVSKTNPPSSISNAVFGDYTTASQALEVIKQSNSGKMTAVVGG